MARFGQKKKTDQQSQQTRSRFTGSALAQQKNSGERFSGTSAKKTDYPYDTTLAKKTDNPFENTAKKYPYDTTLAQQTPKLSVTNDQYDKYKAILAFTKEQAAKSAQKAVAGNPSPKQAMAKVGESSVPSPWTVQGSRTAATSQKPLDRKSERIQSVMDDWAKTPNMTYTQYRKYLDAAQKALGTGTSYALKRGFAFADGTTNQQRQQAYENFKELNRNIGAEATQAQKQEYDVEATKARNTLKRIAQQYAAQSGSYADENGLNVDGVTWDIEGMDDQLLEQLATHIQNNTESAEGKEYIQHYLDALRVAKARSARSDAQLVASNAYEGTQSLTDAAKQKADFAANSKYVKPDDPIYGSGFQIKDNKDYYSALEVYQALEALGELGESVGGEGANYATEGREIRLDADSRAHKIVQDALGKDDHPEYTLDQLIRFFENGTKYYADPKWVNVIKDLKNLKDQRDFGQGTDIRLNYTTQDERDALAYYYNTGDLQSAIDLLHAMEIRSNQAYTDTMIPEWHTEAQNDPLSAWIQNRGLGIEKAFLTPIQALEANRLGSGAVYSPIFQANQQFATNEQAIKNEIDTWANTSEAGKWFNKNIGKRVGASASDVAQFVYDTVNSGVDNALRDIPAIATGQAGWQEVALVIMSSQVASDTLFNDLQKNYSLDSALAHAFWEGIKEYGTEKIGGEFATSGLKGSNFGSYLVKATVPEGVEEVMGGAADMLYDRTVGRNYKSDHYQNVLALVESGMSWDDAESQVTRDEAKEVLKEGASAALSMVPNAGLNYGAYQARNRVGESMRQNAELNEKISQTAEEIKSLQQQIEAAQDEAQKSSLREKLDRTEARAKQMKEEFAKRGKQITKDVRRLTGLTLDYTKPTAEQSSEVIKGDLGDGKTIQTVTKDGNIVTSDGTEMKASEVDWDAMPKTKDLYDKSMEAAREYGVAPGVIYGSYDARMDVEDYIQGVRDIASTASYRGDLAELTAKNQYAAAIAPSMAQAIYDQAATNFDTKRQEQVAQAQNLRALNPENADVTYTPEAEAMLAKEGEESQLKDMVKYVSALAKDSGLSVDYFVSEADETGKIITPEQGSINADATRIRIDLNAGKGNVDDMVTSAILQVAAHEMTHGIATRNPEGFRALTKAVGDVLASRGESLDQYARRRMAAYKEATKGKEMSLDQAMEEVVAQASERVLGDSKYAQEVAEKSPSLAQSIRDFFRKFAQRIKKLLSDGKYLSETSLAMSKSMDKIAKVWDDAVRGINAEGTGEGQESAEEIPQGERFAMREPVEQVGDLVAVHNITEQNLKTALDRGGFPGPSIAILKAKMGHTDFGPISVVFRASTIDPEADTRNVVFGGDAWTPSYPRVSKNLSPDKVAEVNIELNKHVDNIPIESVRKSAKNFVLEHASEIEQAGGTAYFGDYFFRSRDTGLIALFAAQQSNAKELFDEANKAGGLPFLQSDGLRKIVMQKYAPEFFAWLDSLGEKLDTKKYLKSRIGTLYEDTPENAVKVMFERGNRNTAGPDAVASTMRRYNSLDQIREDKNRLPDTQDERLGIYDKEHEIDSELSDAVNDLMRVLERVKQYPSFAELQDMVYRVIGQANDTGETIESVLKEALDFAHYNGYEKGEAGKLFRQVVSTLEDINARSQQNMTKYFEAKPERVVGLDEVAAVIYPDDVSDSIKEALAYKDIEAFEYMHDDREDRIERLNGVSEFVNARFSLRQSDADYMSAVERGDMETAQRLVDEAAERAFANSKIRDEDGKLLKVYHGSDEDFTVFDRTKGRANMDIQGMFFSPWEEDAGGYGRNVRAFYLNITNPAAEGAGYKALNAHKGQNGAGISAREDLIRMGYDGVNNYDEEYIAFNPEQIKSADPVTYDDDGNVIPLSERFNPEEGDIRYALRDFPTSGIQFKALNEYSEEKMNAIMEYLEAVDEGLAEYYMASNQQPSVYRKPYTLGRVNDHTAKLIEQVTGIDTKGWNVKIDRSASQHIFKRHGPAGEANRSMRDVNDVSRMEYVVETADSVQIGRDTRAYRGSDGSRAKAVSISKAVNGTFYIISAVPDSKARSIMIVSAFIDNKKEASAVSGSTIDRSQLYVQDGRQSASGTIVSESSDSVNPQNSDSRNSLRTESEMSDREVLGEAMKEVANGRTEAMYLDRYQQTYYDLIENERELRNQRRIMRKSDEGSEEYRAAKNRADIYQKRVADKTAALEKLEQDPRFAVMAQRERDRAEAAVARDFETGAAIEQEREELIRGYEKKLRDRRLSLEEYKRGRRESADRSRYIDRITDTAKDLSEMLASKTDKKHVPDALAGPLSDFLGALNLYSKRSNAGGKMTQKDLKLSQLLNHVKDAAQQSESLGNLNRNGDYAGSLYLPQGFFDTIAALARNMENLEMVYRDADPIVNMSVENLRVLDQTIRTLKRAIQDVNKTFANASYAKVEDMSRKSILHLNGLGPASKRQGDLKRYLQWSMATPVYAFDRFGDVGKSLFKEISKGYGERAQRLYQIEQYAASKWSAKEARSWDNHVRTFGFERTSEDGGKTTVNVDLTDSQIMSIYLLMNRGQGRQHALTGGIRAKDIMKGSKILISQPEAAHLTEEEIRSITSTLSDRQIEVCKAISDFMKTTSDWGNEVSMRRFGYRAFGEANYFPIETDEFSRAGMPENKGQGNNLYRLMNMTFTKALNPHANNALVVDSIFSVFASHATDMATYSTMALPALDMIRWYNYHAKLDDGTLISTRGSMARAYGNSADQYVRYFISDFSGSTRTSERGEEHKVLGKVMSHSKRASVAANLSVVLKQPGSILRAAYVLPRAAYHRPTAVVSKATYEEMLEHSGIARWKSMGYFDTNLAKPMEDRISKGQSKGDKLLDFTTKGAEWMDRSTMVSIWSAAKSQIAHDNPNMDRTSKEYYQKVTDLFEDVIYRTQVVDSTMTRSQSMRNPGFLGKVMNAFQAEPTLSYNVLMDSLTKAWEEHRQGRRMFTKETGSRMAMAAITFVGTGLVEALVSSIMSAYRDDDDYETFLDKFKEMMGENVLENLNPINSTPLIKYLIDQFSGNSSTIVDSGFTNLSYALQKLKKVFWKDGKFNEDWKQSLDANWQQLTRYAVSAASYLSGLPAYNAAREAWSAWNTVMDATGNYQLKYHPYSDKGSNVSKVGMYYDALRAGDQAEIARLKSVMENAGLTGDKFEDAFRKIVKSEFLAGALSENEAVEVLTQELGLPETGTKSAYYKVQEWAWDQEERSYDGNFGIQAHAKDAILSGDAEAIEAAKKELREYYDKDEKGVASTFSEVITALYKAGEIDAETAEELYREHTNKKEKDIQKAVGHSDNIASDLRDLGKSGNVDLLNRPRIPTSKLSSAGWDEDSGGYATVYSSTYTAGNGRGYDFGYKNNVVINVTPILNDGSVLSPWELENYLEDAFKSGDAIKYDSRTNGGKGLIISIDPVTSDIDEAIKRAEEKAVRIHELHEQYYGE